MLPPCGSCVAVRLLKMRMKSLALTLTLVLLLCVGCSDKWEGFVYPNKHDLTKHRNLEHFSSLEECRAAARGVLAELNALERGDYECGKNCDDGSKLGGIKICKEICKETLR
jgi:hypothetical protein